MSTAALESSPDTMNLAELTLSAYREIDRYRRKEPCNDQYCLELLRRATILRDDDAWALWQRQMNEHVLIWLRGHSRRVLALRLDPEEQNYVDDAFTRFWRTISERRTRFETLGAALNYLHLCLHCAVMDAIRSHASPRELPVSDFRFSTCEPLCEDTYHETEVWEVIAQELTTERERQMAYLHFHCNLKPREIVRYCLDLFSSEQEVYQIKRTILERLKRHAHTIKWKLAEELKGN